MAEPTAPRLVGGGMWIGHSMLERIDDVGARDKFLGSLLELLARNGLKAERIDVNAPENDSVPLGVFVRVL